MFLYLKSVSLICVALPETGDLERRFKTLHKRHQTDFPLGPTRREAEATFSCTVISFHRANTKTKTATVVCQSH